MSQFTRTLLIHLKLPTDYTCVLLQNQMQLFYFVHHYKDDLKIPQSTEYWAPHFLAWNIFFLIAESPGQSLDHHHRTAVLCPKIQFSLHLSIMPVGSPLWPRLLSPLRAQSQISFLLYQQERVTGTSLVIPSPFSLTCNQQPGLAYCTTTSKRVFKSLPLSSS